MTPRHDNIVGDCPLHRIGVPPIPAQHLRLVEPTKPDLYDSFADDSECVEDMLSFRSHEPIRDPAEGGFIGRLIMVLVAAFIAALLATGGHLL